MRKTKLARAISFAMGAGVVAAAIPAVSYAQQDDEMIEEVLVTGSRIKTDGFESASPVTVSTALDIKATGINKIEDFLNSLPQLETGDNSYISNGASGTATLDLRGLGANRTLVLINGRRMSPGGAYSSAAADVNQIPTAMIERIEVLTGGASTVYGADAVAGVVNFILREDFEGLEITVGTSGFMHDNNNKYIQGLMDERGFVYPSGGGNDVDGMADTVDILLGGQFADGKGHATLFATYRKGEELRQEARDYSSCALNSAGTGCGGSGNAIVPNFFVSGYSPDGTHGGQYDFLTIDSNSNFIPSVGNTYNFAPVNHFMRPDEKYTLGGTVKYNITDNTRVYGEVMMMDYRTAAQIAESGTFFAEEYILPIDSDLFNESQKQYLRDNYGAENNEVAVYIGKRNVEGGPRSNILENNSYRIVLGVEGSFSENWDYDVNYQKSRVNSYSTYINDFFAPKINDALQAAEYDVFTFQGVTPEQAAGLTGVAILGANISQEIYTGFVSGDTGFSLPTTERTISVAAGIERRDISFDRNADTVYEEGQLLGQGGPTPSIEGAYDVLDVFVEAAIPVVDSLTTELGFRTSDYSTSGRHDTYKLAFSWQPADMVRVRTGFNRAVRSPSVIEIFSPSNLGLWNGDDACAGDTPVYTLEQCARTGVTPDQYGNIIPSPANQYNAIYGGNQSLDPETADTITFGVVIDPIEDLTVSVDYWEIELEDSISNVGPQETIKQCAENGNDAFCALIVRNSSGSLWLGQEGFILSNNQNLGGSLLEGVDIASAYSMNLGDGTLAFKFSGTYLLTKEFITLPGDESTRYDCTGVINSQCFPSPEWRHTLSATFYMDNWSLGGKWRYIGGVDYDDPSEADTIAQGELSGGISYFDLNASYQINEHLEFSASSRNVLDKAPPLVGGTLSTNANTIAGFYDTLGRYVSASLTMTF